MSFIVSVTGERLNAGYSFDAALDAVRKAQSCMGLGEVTITDPHNEEWKGDSFSVMLRLWPKVS